MSFNHDTANKGLTEKREQNVRYEPKAGTIWTYFDAEGEGLVEYSISDIEGSKVTLVKLSGKDIGYTAFYELERLQAKRWKPLDLEAAIREVLWACPDCGSNNPIRIGDYMCVSCRDALDNA